MFPYVVELEVSPLSASGLNMKYWWIKINKWKLKLTKILYINYWKFYKNQKYKNMNKYEI